MEELWDTFYRSGKISDYLKYSASLSDAVGTTNEDMNYADNNIRNSNS